MWQPCRTSWECCDTAIFLVPCTFTRIKSPLPSVTMPSGALKISGEAVAWLVRSRSPAVPQACWSCCSGVMDSRRARGSIKNEKCRVCNFSIPPIVCFVPRPETRIRPTMQRSSVPPARAPSPGGGSHERPPALSTFFLPEAETENRCAEVVQNK